MQMEAVIWTKGTRKAGYVVVTLEGTVEALSLIHISEPTRH